MEDAAASMLLQACAKPEPSGAWSATRCECDAAFCRCEFEDHSPSGSPLAASGSYGGRPANCPRSPSAINDVEGTQPDGQGSACLMGGLAESAGQSVQQPKSARGPAPLLPGENTPIIDRRACKACQKSKCSCSLTDPAVPIEADSRCARCSRLSIACEPNVPRKRACAACRKAKEKCHWDGQSECCVRCTRLKLECAWPKAKARGVAWHPAAVKSEDNSNVMTAGPGSNAALSVGSFGWGAKAGASSGGGRSGGTCEGCKVAKAACDGHRPMPPGSPTANGSVSTEQQLPQQLPRTCSRCERLGVACRWVAQQPRAQELACETCRRRKVSCRRPNGRSKPW